MIRIEHREFQRRVAAEKIAGEAAAFAMGERAVLAIDERHQLVDDEVEPASGGEGVAEERVHVRCGEVACDENDVTNSALGNGVVQQALSPRRRRTSAERSRTWSGNNR